MAFFILVLSFLSLKSYADPDKLIKDLEETRMIKSHKFQTELRASPGVPSHLQSEYSILRYIQKHHEILKGKKVLDIGTGNGIIALYAARRGASHVIATDINPLALKDLQFNAQKLELDKLITTVEVHPDKSGAYDVFKNNEEFDVILSNPPYTLDLSANADGNFTDSSLLGPSIIMGLKTHLAKDGVAILLYRNLFYHSYLVKFAKQLDLEVEAYSTDRIPMRELEVLMNSYAEKVNAKLNLKEPVAFNAYGEEFKDLKIKVENKGEKSLYPGLIIIRKKKN